MFCPGIGYTYATGMLQPGVVALRGAVDTAITAAAQGEAAAGPQPEVLLTWGSVPSAENVNGASGRLEARVAWPLVLRSLGGDVSSSRPAVAQGPPGPPWPLFYLLLMAHGNFVRPAFFTYDAQTAGGRTLKGMLADAACRAAVALALTGTGLWRAPRPTAAALAAYAAYFLRPGGPYDLMNKLAVPEPKSRL